MTTPTRRTVLVLGFDPYRVPMPDPDAVAAALDRGQARFAEFDLVTDTCLIGLDDDVAAVVSAALTARPWDCIVIGGGLRKSPEALELFELVVNLVHRHAPQATIAFNSSPEDSADAAVRSFAAA